MYVMGLAGGMRSLYELDYIASHYKWIQLCGKSYFFGGVVRCWCGGVVRCWCWCCEVLVLVGGCCEVLVLVHYLPNAHL